MLEFQTKYESCEEEYERIRKKFKNKIGWNKKREKPIKFFRISSTKKLSKLNGL